MHERVDEDRRQLVVEDPACGERAQRVRGRLGAVAGQRCDPRAGRRSAQHGDRARHGVRLALEAADAQQHGARDRGGPQRAHRTRVGRASLRQLSQIVEQRAQQEGVAAGRLVAGGRDLGHPVAREPARHELARRGLAQRRRPDQRRGRFGFDLEQRLAIGSRVGAPDPEDHRQRRAVDPRAQVREPAQRGVVAPVRVVDDQHQRRALGHVDGEPVEPVHGRERLQIAHGGVAERRARRLGRAAQQPLALGLRLTVEPVLEQLAHHAPRVVLLELGAAGAQGHDRVHVAGAQQGRLADAGRALGEHHAPAARRGRLEGVRRAAPAPRPAPAARPSRARRSSRPRPRAPARAGP